jgi:Tfp pilus assembly PilM family ATPase
MNQLTIAQQLRDSIKLVKPELLAQVPDEYNPRQVFNYLRHKATNYDFLLEEHRKKYGDVTPAENKALTQGAADVIIEALRTENVDLMQGKANTRFAQFTRAISRLLGLSSDIDLAAIREATKTLKKSQAMYKSWNERYRRQKEMVLKVTKSVDPEIRRQIEAIYNANSKEKLDKLEELLFNG